MNRELRPNSGANRNQGKLELTEELVLRVLTRIRGYMREQREEYVSIGKPLDPGHAAVMKSFFSTTFLAGAKVVQLVGRRVAEPSCCLEARAAGFQGLPEFTHLASVTFQDVLVFNDEMTERLLFQALVRRVQIETLGLDRYVELFIRAFLDSRWLFSVPLEAHAFELESRFAADPKKAFSVEDEVRARAGQNRY